MQQWFETFIPPSGRPTLVLDGDLLKGDWFSERRSPRLSDADGELHTVVPGRPIGLDPQTVAELARLWAESNQMYVLPKQTESIPARRAGRWWVTDRSPASCCALSGRSDRP
jgi:hypothetical protein